MVITDKKKIDALLSRRVAEAIVEDSLRKRMLSGKRVRVKFGADPTAPDLHLGHTVPLKKLKEFQDLGHQIVFIIGDYTARVGDPSGKSKTRPMLTAKEVEKNAETYLAQVGKILDLGKVEVHRNGEWFAKMGMDDVLRLTSQFTVARMIERDDFATRLAGGADVNLHELLYPAMQAYDSVMIESDVEIGGTDQRFNILAGRDLQRKMGKPEQDCLLLGPILVGTDGKQKMSKSLGNAISITESPEEMFGKIMSVPDSALWDYFALTTDLPIEEIAEMRRACEQGKMNPRDAKARLAREIVTQYHSSDAAVAAEARFASVFSRGEVPDDVDETTVKGGKRALVDLLVEIGLALSKSEARRLIEQGGVKVAGKVMDDAAVKVEIGDEPVLIQKGKRHFVRVIKK